MTLPGTESRAVFWRHDDADHDPREGLGLSGRAYRIRGRPIPMHADPLGLHLLTPEAEDSDIAGGELERIGDLWTLYIDTASKGNGLGVAEASSVAEPSRFTPLFQSARLAECYLAAESIETFHCLTSAETDGGADIDPSIEALVRARLVAIIERREAMAAAALAGFTPAQRRDPAVAELYAHIDAVSAAIAGIEIRLDKKSIRIPVS